MATRAHAMAKSRRRASLRRNVWRSARPTRARLGAESARPPETHEAWVTTECARAHASRAESHRPATSKCETRAQTAQTPAHMQTTPNRYSSSRARRSTRRHAREARPESVAKHQSNRYYAHRLNAPLPPPAKVPEGAEVVRPPEVCNNSPRRQLDAPRIAKFSAGPMARCAFACLSMARELPAPCASPIQRSMGS